MEAAYACDSRQPSFIQKVLACFLSVVLLSLSTTRPALPQAPLALAVAGSVAALGALAVGINGLMNSAISQANQDAIDRLQQLDGIVNGALFSLTRAMNYGIDKMNNAMQANLRILNKNANDIVDKFGALTTATLDQAQKYLNSDLVKVADGLGNAIAQVDFINTTPALDIPGDGLSIIRSHSGTTKLFLTGVGLAKGSIPPTVQLISANGTKTRVNVDGYSLAFLKLSIPTSALSGSDDYTLSFRFVTSPGTFVDFHETQNVPLLACAPTKISISTKIWMTGQAWEENIRQLRDGNMASGDMYHVTCVKGDCDDIKQITAYEQTGWELYTPPDWNGHAILCSKNSSNGHAEINYLSPVTCKISVNGSEGNSHLNVVVQVAERKRINKDVCGKVLEDKREFIGAAHSVLEFSEADLRGDCDSGYIVKTVFKSSLGDATDSQHATLADKQLSIDVGEGIVNFRSLPVCAEREYGEVVLHK
jgi:hypothetical protein